MDFDVVHSARNYYELLGLSSSADDKELRHAFRSLSKILHPDTTSLPADEAACRFQQVCEAYELLSDPIRRAAYDDCLAGVKSDQTTPNHQSFSLGKNVSIKTRTIDVRRSFSEGEVLSLFLLVLTLLISLLLAIVFAFTQGRELQIRPSWLIVGLRPENVIVKSQSNVSVALISNTFESTFAGSNRSLAAWNGG